MLVLPRFPVYHFGLTYLAGSFRVKGCTGPDLTMRTSLVLFVYDHTRLVGFVHRGLPGVSPGMVKKIGR